LTGNADPAEGRIVVGVDGTGKSAAAVRWAIREALLRQASVHLIFADDRDRRSRARPGRVRRGPMRTGPPGRRCWPRSSWRARPCRRVICHLN